MDGQEIILVETGVLIHIYDIAYDHFRREFIKTDDPGMQQLCKLRMAQIDGLKRQLGVNSG